MFCTTPSWFTAKLESTEAGAPSIFPWRHTGRGRRAHSCSGMDRQMPFPSRQKLWVRQHQTPMKRPDRQKPPKSSRAAERKGVTTEGLPHLLGTRPRQESTSWTQEPPWLSPAGLSKGCLWKANLVVLEQDKSPPGYAALPRCHRSESQAAYLNWLSTKQPKTSLHQGCTRHTFLTALLQPKVREKKTDIHLKV